MDDRKPDWVQISRLLDQALALPPESRTTWLDQLGDEFANLKPPLRDMLSREAAIETDSFLAPIGKISLAAARDSIGASISPVELAEGCSVGPYRLVKPLGEGGMGSVWLAERTDGLIKRQVALKLPNLPLHLKGIAERFAREREILASLTHPNIAQLYDAGVDASGQPFLALEYVDGLALTRYCDEKRLSIRARLGLFIQVLSAVQYAHSNLVLHRDLKPSNILVNAEGVVKLLDFGIAKLMIEGSASETELTQIGGRALSLDYASPEQIMGQPLTTASDVYSLGVLLCELLTGERPYRLKRGTRAELEEAILAADPARLSTLVKGDAQAGKRAVTPTQLSRQLTGDLESIAGKALAKKPEQRYPGVAALAEDIERHLRGDIVLAQPESRWYRAKKFGARNKFTITALGGAVAALAIGLGLALWQAAVAAKERDRALENADRSALLNGFLQTLIGGAGSIDSPVAMRDLLLRSEKWANAESSGDPAQQAALLRALASIYLSLGQAAKAHELLLRAKTLAGQSRDKELDALITCQAAYTSSLVTKNPEAKEQMTKSLAFMRNDHSSTAVCLNYLAFTAQNEDDAVAAVMYSERALASVRQARRPQPALTLSLRASLARSKYLAGTISESDTEFESVINEMNTAGMNDSPLAISARNNWAILRIGSGDARQALVLYDQLIRDASARSPDGRAPVYAYANRARALSLLGDTEAATTAYQVAYDLASKSKLSQFVLYTVVGLAETSLAQGNAGKAEEWLNMAKSLLGSIQGQKHPAAIGLMMVESDLAMSRGQFDQARTLLTKIVDVLNDGRKPSSTVSSALRRRSQAVLALGLATEAARDADASLTIAQGLRGTNPHSYLIGNSLLAQACVAAAAGEGARAIDLAKQATGHFSDAVLAGHVGRRIANELETGKIGHCPARW